MQMLHHETLSRQANAHVAALRASGDAAAADSAAQAAAVQASVRRSFSLRGARASPMVELPPANAFYRKLAHLVGDRFGLARVVIPPQERAIMMHANVAQAMQVSAHLRGR